jgi:hypothetical protein
MRLMRRPKHKLAISGPMNKLHLNLNLLKNKFPALIFYNSSIKRVSVKTQNRKSNPLILFYIISISRSYYRNLRRISKEEL